MNTVCILSLVERPDAEAVLIERKCSERQAT